MHLIDTLDPSSWSQELIGGRLLRRVDKESVRPCGWGLRDEPRIDRPVADDGRGLFCLEMK